MEAIVVGMADCVVADIPGQLLSTYALGSCIAVAVHDLRTQVGGLLHFMLPDSSLDPARGRANPFMFADTGITLMLDRLTARGATRLVAHIAGGARVTDGEDVLEIGRRNYRAARRILRREGVLLHGEAVGGSHARNVHLEIGTGMIRVDENGAGTLERPA